ncbi:helix-turn-helix transcriptional regulator [Enterococcus alishanensis]
METWQEIQQTIDYIEDHLQQDLRAIDLAKMAHLSPFYYQRLFKRLVGRSFSEYVKLRRLAKASQLLLETDHRILDIAIKTGFQSHAVFTKAFKSAYGLTPEKFRQERPLLNQVAKPELRLMYTDVDENVPLITSQMVLEIQRHTITVPETYLGFIGDLSIASHIPIAGATGIDGPAKLWKKFHRVKKNYPVILPDGPELGASFLKDQSIDPTTLGKDASFNYFAGGKSDGTLVPDLAEWRMEPGEYVVCHFEAEDLKTATMQHIDTALKYLLEIWLPAHKIHIAPFSVEKYLLSTEQIQKIEIWVKILNQEL